MNLKIYLLNELRHKTTWRAALKFCNYLIKSKQITSGFLNPKSGVGISYKGAQKKSLGIMTTFCILTMAVTLWISMCVCVHICQK